MHALVIFLVWNMTRLFLEVIKYFYFSGREVSLTQMEGKLVALLPIRSGVA